LDTRNGWRPWRVIAVVRGQRVAVVLVGCALVAAGLVYLTRRQAGTTRVATATGSPCSAQGIGPITQAADGTIRGCMRIPPDAAGIDTVSLSTFVPTPPAFDQRSAQVVIRLSPTEGGPGTVVHITGHFVGAPPAGLPTGYTDACWDACPDGLMEDGLPVTWAAGGSFATSVAVPDTAWLEPNGVHPLESGSYPIGLQCLGPLVRGCGGAPSQGEAIFHLMAPTPARCASGQPCGELHLSPEAGLPGNVVAISGWAPIGQIIGEPFGYGVQVAPNGGGTPAPSPQITVARAALDVLAAPRWSGADARQQTSYESALPPALTADPLDPSRIAYCAQDSIRLTTDGGGTWMTIPTDGVTAGADVGAMRLEPMAGGPPGCTTVALDPSRPATVYAAFMVSVDGQGPPFELAALVSPDAGRTWHPLPVPDGATAGTFSGFEVGATAVTAIFGSGSAALVAERTDDGGNTWQPAPSLCPPSGACVVFGPYSVGHCAMSGAPRAIVYSPDGGASWDTPTWADTVDACDDSELVTLAGGSVVLVDPSSGGYLVRRSSDGGRTWQYLATPALPSSAGAQPEVSLLPDGDLLSWAPGAPWLLLRARRSRWCTPAIGTVGAAAQTFETSEPAVIGGRVWWLEMGSSGDVSAASRPLAELSCT